MGNNETTELELSNYWGDFKLRVKSTIDNLHTGKLSTLKRLTVHLTQRRQLNALGG